MKKYLKTCMGILIFVILVIMIVNFASGGVVTYYFNMMIYSQKADEDKVAKTFNMQINRESHDGRDYIYYGTDNNTDEEKYIVLAYADGEYHEIYASEGFNEEEAIAMAVEKDYEINCSDLVLMDTYGIAHDDNILEHLDWFVYEDSMKGSLRIDFLTGEIKDEWLN